MNKAIRFKLFVMMVLEFFIWGAWLPLIFGYLPSLGFTPARAVAGSSTPFRSPRSSACSSATSSPTGISRRRSFWRSATDRRPGDARSLAFTRSFWPFFALMLVHCLLYVPTISITNSIAFANMKDRAEGVRHRAHGRHDRLDSRGLAVHVHPRGLGEGAAPPIRRGSSNWLGTVLGSGLTGAGAEGRRRSGRSSWPASRRSLLAAFSLTLPHTPPKPVEGGRGRAGLARGDEAAQASLRARAVARHVRRFLRPQLLLQLDRTFPRHGGGRGRRRHPRQLDHAGHEHRPDRGDPHDVRPRRDAEDARLAHDDDRRHPRPRGALRRLSRSCRSIRRSIILVKVLHGICYAFFFATVYIFVDAYLPEGRPLERAGTVQPDDPRRRRAGGELDLPDAHQQTFNHGGVIDFQGLFLVPLLSALGAAVALALFFHPPDKKQCRSGIPATSH